MIGGWGDSGWGDGFLPDRLGQDTKWSEDGETRRKSARIDMGGDPETYTMGGDR